MLFTGKQAEYPYEGWKIPCDIFLANWSGVAMCLILTYCHFGLRETIKHADRWGEGNEADQERSESSEEHAA